MSAEKPQGDLLVEDTMYDCDKKPTVQKIPCKFGCGQMRLPTSKPMTCKCKRRRAASPAKPATSERDKENVPPAASTDKSATKKKAAKKQRPPVVTGIKLTHQEAKKTAPKVVLSTDDDYHSTDNEDFSALARRHKRAERYAAALKDAFVDSSDDEVAALSDEVAVLSDGVAALSVGSQSSSACRRQLIHELDRSAEANALSSMSSCTDDGSDSPSEEDWCPSSEDEDRTAASTKLRDVYMKSEQSSDGDESDLADGDEGGRREDVREDAPVSLSEAKARVDAWLNAPPPPPPPPSANSSAATFTVKRSANKALGTDIDEPAKKVARSEVDSAMAHNQGAADDRANVRSGGEVTTATTVLAEGTAQLGAPPVATTPRAAAATQTTVGVYAVTQNEARALNGKGLWLSADEKVPFTYDGRFAPSGRTNSRLEVEIQLRTHVGQQKKDCGGVTRPNRIAAPHKYEPDLSRLPTRGVDEPYPVTKYINGWPYLDTNEVRCQQMQLQRVLRDGHFCAGKNGICGATLLMNCYTRRNMISTAKLFTVEECKQMNADKWAGKCSRCLSVDRDDIIAAEQGRKRLIKINQDKKERRQQRKEIEALRRAARVHNERLSARQLTRLHIRQLRESMLTTEYHRQRLRLAGVKARARLLQVQKQEKDTSAGKNIGEGAAEDAPQTGVPAAAEAQPSRRSLAAQLDATTMAALCSDEAEPDESANTELNEKTLRPVVDISKLVTEVDSHKELMGIVQTRKAERTRWIEFMEIQMCAHKTFGQFKEAKRIKRRLKKAYTEILAEFNSAK